MRILKQVDRTGEESTAVSHGLALVAAALTGTIAAWAIERYLRAHIGHDQAWDLYASAEILRGVPMNGRDLVEVNPPFLLWFMSLPVLLGRALRVGPIPGFRMFFLLIALPATAWSASLFRRLVRPRPLVFWLFLLLVSWAGGVNLYADDLGQREHITVFLLLPYILLAAMRIERRAVSLTEGITIGVASAISICLKPQHMLDIVAVEVLILWRFRSFRAWFHPAWAAFSLGLAGYFCAARLFAPAYFTNIVPLLRLTYWGFNSSLHEVLFEQRRTIGGLAAGALILWVLRTRLRMATLEMVLATASAGALAAYVQQHKGWTYQMICGEFFTSLLTGLLLVDLLDRALIEFTKRPLLRLRGLYIGVALLLGVALGLTRAYRHRSTPPYLESEKATLALVYGSYPAGTPVGFFSVNPWQFPTVLEQDKVWASRYYHLWLLPAILRSENPADGDRRDHLSPTEIERLSTLLRSDTAADLAHWQPKVVVTQACALPSICDGLRQQHLATVLEWFLRDETFRREWRHYTLQQTIDDLDVYTRTQ